MTTPLEFFWQRINEKMDAGHYTAPDGQFTIGAFICAVMEIQDEEEARGFYDGAVEFYKAVEDRALLPEDLACSNIGWCFGEGMEPERREMWVRVCDASHPVFGQRLPSAEEAFRLGAEWATR